MGLWVVCLRGLPERSVEANSRDDAIAAYKVLMGVVTSVHPFDAWPAVPAETSAAQKPKQETPPQKGTKQSELPGVGVPVTVLPITDSLMSALGLARLGTIADVVAYGREHGSLAALDGIGQDGDRELQRAIVTWKHHHRG